MSIWRDIFETGRPEPFQKAPQEEAQLDGPLGAFLKQVRRWSCPLFFACDECAKTSVKKDASASASGRTKGIHSVAFTIAVVVLSAKLAKADGHVTRDEVAIFKQLFSVPTAEQKNVGRLFNQARKDSAGFEGYAQQLSRMFDQEKRVLSDLVGCLFTIAAADGRISEEEVDYLRDVAKIFGISADEFGDIANRYDDTPIDDPYLILGVSPEDAPETIKRKYKRLVARIHPDRLVAEGLPEERLEMATKQLARVNEAFALIEAKPV